MKTRDQILDRIKHIKEQPQMKQKSATLDTNAVLALIQCDMEGQIEALNWVLRSD